MKAIGWIISAGLVAATTAATAQARPPYQAGSGIYRNVSDLGGPYAAMPPEAPMPRDANDGDGPRWLPAREVYSVLRENGYSPLGIPRRRGPFYAIAAIDPNGDDGRLLIDARDGQIVRFMPAYLREDAAFDAVPEGYGLRALPPPRIGRAAPSRRPMPQLASRTPSVPLPKPHPVGGPNVDASQAAKRQAPQPAPQQSAAAQPSTITHATAPAVEAKPSPQILPTQPMPPVQALE
ncbi:MULTISPECIES: hypothetical protein [Rhodopseudomonas]|uniref:Uncharacterized protein n=1 Tax=Rhodopseudomonas palustris TaxID=1076 RepID=A0A0D7F564_RHOPL|nr:MULTISPECIES: hypothetical protein [Rhodopseudomonas]KIZ48213.1 hypothetical protein OO17_00125 [Rhodopseudomonas palustris]MDF3812080.1 hypothetical protein [Rhodopseudomonas sp. BAL398]WOK17126.1 hypothetical protein RBJ75_23860 [Rhodopseudomonas sp. BAL398]